MREGVAENNLDACLDVLECRSVKDAVVRDDTLIVMKPKTMVIGESISVACCLVHLLSCEGQEQHEDK